MESSTDDLDQLQASQISQTSQISNPSLSSSSISSISWPAGRPASNGGANGPRDFDPAMSATTQSQNGGPPISHLSHRQPGNNNTSSPSESASASAFMRGPDSTPETQSYPVRFGPYLHRDNLPGEPKSLSGIATRAFLLGISLGISGLLTLLLPLIYKATPLWRAPFFLATLSLFHFLEFWTTARYNTPQASVSAFLLSSNGSAYNIAHTAALVECVLHYTVFSKNSSSSFSISSASLSASTILAALGFVLILLGQTVRTIAMVHAGTNFNHTVQMRRNAGHELVTSGIYAYLRHPSYFGFFWWGLGTQLVLGNVVCLVGYAVVLWRFFSRRIDREEELLVSFFGKEYIDYRAKTRVGIPFVR